MGDIKLKKKKYKRPKRPFDKQRIDEENVLTQKYGLKNKREIWRAESEIAKIRRRAKSLIPKSDEERKEFFEKLNKQGFGVKETSDALALTKEDWFNRRLQTVLFNKKLSKTIKQARQLIVHKYVLVDGKVVNSPGFMVSLELDKKIEIKIQKQKPKKIKVVEEVSAKPTDEKVEEPKGEELKEEVDKKKNG